MPSHESLNASGRAAPDCSVSLPSAICIRRAGAAATELAISMPLLLLVGLAAADFGRIAHFAQIVSNAARTAAETGATHGFTEHTRTSWEAGVRQAAIDELRSIPSFNDALATYASSAIVDGNGLAHIEVTVSYPFRTTVSWPLLPSEVRLQRRFEIRQFR